MNGLWWLVLTLVIVLLLWLGKQFCESEYLAHFIPVFLALSSCLGTNFRARIAGVTINPRRGAYDETLFRTMTNHAPPSSEHIELETMLNQRAYPEYDDD